MIAEGGSRIATVVRRVTEGGTLRSVPAGLSPDRLLFTQISHPAPMWWTGSSVL